MASKTGWEVVRSAVSREEMASIDKSYWLSLQRTWLPQVGGLCRIVICGWSVEVYRPQT